MLLRQSAGVILRLPLGGAYRPIPSSGPACRHTGPNLPRILGDQVRLPRIPLFRLGPFGGLLRLHDEAIALVQVDPALGCGAVVELVVDTPFKDVVIEFIPCLRRIGLRQAKQVAEFIGEHLEVRQFRAARLLPSTNEGVDIGTDHTVVRPCRLCFYLTHVANIAKVVISETLECSYTLSRPATRSRLRWRPQGGVPWR